MTDSAGSRSSIWNHVIEIGLTGDKIQCKYCSTFWLKKILKGCSSPIISHLIKKHPSEYNAMKRENV